MELLPERPCGECNDRQRVAWGCVEPAKEKLNLDGVDCIRCPKRPLLDEPETLGHIFWLYRQMGNGYLPEAGGLENQPAKYADYMRIIDRALDVSRQEKERRETARSSRGGPRAGTRR